MTKTREKAGELISKLTPKLSPFEEMDRMFDEFLGRGFLTPLERHWPAWAAFNRTLESRFPRMDVIDRDDELLVQVEVPGVHKDDLEVTIHDDLLTVKGKTHEEREEKGEYFRAEIAHGTFSRTLRLPVAVQADKAKAKARFEAGVLEIRLPKTEAAKSQVVDIE